MATATAHSPTLTETLFDFRHRITIEEFHQMVTTGVFGDEPRVELIEGVVVDKMTKYPPHVQATDLIQYALTRQLPQDSYFVTMGNPMTIDERLSEPEPDAMVLRGRLRDYAGRRRSPQDAALVVEVADSSYPYDRQVKWVIYAAAGVPIYWVLDLNRRRLEVHTDPIGEGTEAAYRTSQLHLEGEEVPLVLDGLEVARLTVNDLLP